MKIIVLCSLIAFGSSASAWGPLGHEAVARIALQQLSPATALKVKSILGSDDFAEAANWADVIKPDSRWKHAASYHYASVDDGSSYFERLASLPAEKQNQGDVVMAISKCLLVLRDTTESSLNKKYALKFLIHLIGDIHQPLHVGRADDKGGNAILVNWYGKTINLHWLWDGAIIDTAYADKLKTIPASQHSRWLANYLLAKSSKTNRYQGRLDIEEWMNGAFALRSLVYNGYNSSNDSYIKATLPAIESQMLKAGLNLAATLNEALADNSVISAGENELIKSLSKALGRDLRQIVRLRPVNSVDQHQDQQSGEQKACH